MNVGTDTDREHQTISLLMESEIKCNFGSITEGHRTGGSNVVLEEN